MKKTMFEKVVFATTWIFLVPLLLFAVFMLIWTLSKALVAEFPL